MRRLSVILPAIGIVAAVSVPLARYAGKNRDELVAVQLLQRVNAAQQDFRVRYGGYATELASLMSACPGDAPLLPGDLLEQLHHAGYALELRLAAGAAQLGADCGGRPVVSDYYAGIRAVSPVEAAQQAFAVRGDGRIYLFYDGIPPREADIEAGLATALEDRETFRIP